MIYKSDSLAYLELRSKEREWSRLGNIQVSQVKKAFENHIKGRLIMPEDLRAYKAAIQAKTFPELIKAIESATDSGNSPFIRYKE